MLELPKMISIEMLQVAHGDSLWIEYGAAGQTRRILIDGGPAHTYENGLRKRMLLLPQNDRNFELMVITHIDADHIDGALIMLQEKNGKNGLKFNTKEFWFNGWNQLARSEAATYAPLQGEFLGGLLTVDPDLKKGWNKSFKKGPVMVNENEPLPEILLEGGARLTLIGPTNNELRRLRARWASAIRDFTPGDVDEALRRLKERRDYKPPVTPAVFSAPQYGSDRTPANGSSISFVLEYEGVSLLLLGDAHASTLAKTLARLSDQRSAKPLRFDAVKLPHHGSMANVSSDWLRLVDCERWLISTNGAVFGHPDIATVELIASECKKKGSKKPTIYCNYLSDTTSQLKDNADWLVEFLDSRQPSNGGGAGLLFEPGASGVPELISGRSSAEQAPKRRSSQKRRKAGRKRSSKRA